MDIYAIRKARLLRFIELEFDGAKRRFADRAKLGQTPEGSRTQVHRWLTKSPTAASRNIEYASARYIEEQLQLIPMSLDQADPAAPYRDTPHDAGQKPEAILPLGYSGRISKAATCEEAQEPSYGWPFPLVDRRRYEQLDADDQELVQRRMNKAIAFCESEAAGRSDAPNSKQPAHARRAQ